MFNTNSIKFPSYNFPTHILTAPLFFVLEEDFFSFLNNPVETKKQILQSGDPVQVLDHGLGKNGEWCKIKTSTNLIGYISFKNFNSVDTLQPLQNIKPFFSVNPNEIYQPNINSQRIDWKSQPINLVYEDSYNGAFVVHYNLEDVVSVGNKDSLLAYMEKARYEGTKLILKHLGFVANDQTLNDLLNNYYLFSSAEEWYLNPHNCSTLRVAVAIPTRYLKAQNNNLINISGEIIPSYSEQEKIDGLPKSISDLNKDVDANPNLFALKFSNYDEYKTFFERLIYTLDKYSFYYFTKEWIIDPDIALFLPFEIENIKRFMRATNDLLVSNHPNEFYDRVENILLISEDSFALPGQKRVWKNSLNIYFNKATLELVDIKYYSSNQVYSLNNSLGNYLNKEEIKNKTTLNYLINFNQLTDYYNYTAADMFSGGLATLEEKMKDFLVSNHYPKINSLEAKPLDLYNCTKATIDQYRSIVDSKIPSEIQKWKNLINTYDTRKKPLIEDDLFLRSIRSFDYVTDRNIRVLFGIEKLEGLSAKQQIQEYLSAANCVDWGKFLGVAAQCLMLNLPVNIVAELLEKYKEAKKYLDALAQTTICNPFLKNGLRTINTFSWPSIPAYNPNQNFLKELETAFYKVIKELVVFGIKTALTQAAKACINNETQNLLSQSAAGRVNNPIEADTNDPAINDLLEEITKKLNNSNTPPTEIQKQKTGNYLKNIIDDITACMTLREMCLLYKGQTISDDSYLIISSLIKRKYPDLAYKFSNKQDIFIFFSIIGSKINLEICNDLEAPESPLFSNLNSGQNILCDDGKIKALKENLLADRLSPELLNAALEDIKNNDAKALEDVLKLLDSDNPFDFSKVPDLACKVLPSGQSLAPSMLSFGRLTNSLMNSTYNVFDAEAKEWYKTTYSTISDKPSVLTLNKQTFEISASVSVPENLTNSMKNILNGKSSENDANSLKETKKPAFMFKQHLSSANAPSPKYFNDDYKYISVSGFLDGNEQEKLDLNIIEKTLRDDIQQGELLLIQFIKRAFGQLLANLGVEFTRATANTIAALDFNINNPANQNFTFIEIINNIKPLTNLLAAMDSYLRSNITDSQILRSKMNNLYTVLGIDDRQEANGFFAIENGAALYTVICEHLSNNTTKTQLLNALNNSRSSVINTLFTDDIIDTSVSLESLLQQCLQKYEEIKKFYKAILSIKVNYPDFDYLHQSGLNKYVSNNIIFNSYNDGKYRDIQRLEILKNKKNHIRITEIDEAPQSINDYIKTFGITAPETNNDKVNLFKAFLEKKSNDFNEPYVFDKNTLSVSYENINKYIFNYTKQNILSSNNKFIQLKNLQTGLSEQTGSGQPYTQYLALVVTQSVQQKNCGIRPNYLDIDYIKKDILDDKANNNCIERIVDDRTVGNKPINSNQLKDIEVSSTQSTLLKGNYRLAVRIFLHDLLLRSIPIFGIYDPQSLKNEPLFVSFMAKMCESEMRGMDNSFFVLLSEFLLKNYKNANPNEEISNVELKKSLLFRDLVFDELSKYTLSRLAKRINVETNLNLKNIKEEKINLINIYNDVLNYKEIIYVENKAVYLKLNNLNKSFKIYANESADNNDDVLNQFINNSIEYQFLFKFIFNPAQHLTSLFIINCLSTTTRKQIVNAFRGTKRDIMSTCKIIQANGQKIINDPNDSQALSIDPMELIKQFIIDTLIKTPIQILKGVAETSEPNLAIITTAFRFARTFEPKLTSFLIPATSLPLGLIPTPITSPLPFLNLPLSIAYFGLLAWYDDKPLDELINGAKDNLENNMMQNMKCDNVSNQDSYYLDGQAITTEGYQLDKDKV